jgi:glutaredoxin
MNKKILLILLIVFSSKGISQGLKVLISEDKKGKRVILMAENKTQDTLNVFLMVNAEGYRRSASKPVIKNIAPHSKVPMITLIELEGVESRYTYDLVVNDKDYSVDVNYKKEQKDIERILKGQVVIFTADGCEKCHILIDSLKTGRIQHRSFNISEDATLYGQFIAFIERKLTADTRIRFPVVWNKDEVIFGYEDLKDLLILLAD